MILSLTIKISKNEYPKRVVKINFKERFMDYRVVDGTEAINLRDRKGTDLVKNIDYNLSTVFQLSDLSYLVMPINPFAKCLITFSKSTLDSWIEQRDFPTDETYNQFYFENKVKIDNLLIYKEELKSELLKYIYLENRSPLGSEDVDYIHQILKKRRKTKQFRLHFHVLVGDQLIKNNPDLFGRWGILEDKQLLNPIVFLVLVSKRNGVDKYFELERYIIGKTGYYGCSSIQQSFENFSRISNTIVGVTKIFE